MKILKWCVRPEHLKWFHLGRVVLFIALIPISLYLKWAESLTFITILSLWALVEGALAAYAGARAERATEAKGDA